MNKHILRRDVEPSPPLFEYGDTSMPMKTANESEALAAGRDQPMGKDEVWGRDAMGTTT